MEVEKRKLLGKAGNNKLKMFAIVPIALAVVLMLVLASGFVQVPTAIVTKEKLATESHCPVCDYLQYDGATQYGFDGTAAEFEAKYGVDGGRDLLREVLRPSAYCGGSSGGIDAIIAEYEATGSLDGYFSALYSYDISGLVSEEINIGESIQKSAKPTHLGAISFGIPSTVPRISGGIPAIPIKTHYTVEDLGISYAEIYQRSLDIRTWLDGGAYPTWAGNPGMTNAEIDCIQWGLRGAGVVSCAVAAYVTLSVFFAFDAAIAAIQALLNFGPEMVQLAQDLFWLCVEIISAIRLGLGMPL